MRERTGQILKIACLVLAALLVYQLVRTVFRINPLAHVAIPALPSLASDTNTPAAAGGKGTNSVSSAARGTNTSPNVSGTNSAVAKMPKEKGTNFVAGVSTNVGTTNISGPLTPSAGARENVVESREKTSPATNAPAAATLETENKTTNAWPTEPVTNVTLSTPDIKTNNPLSPATAGTTFILPPPTIHGSMTATISGTNSSLSTTNTEINSVSLAKSKRKGTNSTGPSEMAMTGMSGGGKSTELPPEIKARVDRIYESEIFGMVMRPQPMALQGIAGNSAFLRSPSGQTGLVKEGDSLGELKLLKIGINRVLVEQDGKKSELTIFEGYGSESLMPKDKETAKDKEISK